MAASMTQSTGLLFRNARSEDAGSIASIYNYYVAHTFVSFEEEAVDAGIMAGRIAAVFEQNLPWLVAVDDSGIVGYAYASPWRSRAAYRYSVESSIYLQRNYCGRGIGSQLMQALINSLQALPVHSVIAGIALPNPASVALHEKFGMEKVSHHREVGNKNGHWLDVGYWQLLLPLTQQA